MSIGILSWQNEHGLANYPFGAPHDVRDLIVDAALVQFDGFLPILQTILVSSTDITLTIKFDLVTKSFTYLKSSFDSGVRHLSMYDGDRFLGRLVFGNGIQILWANYVSQLLSWNLEFLACVVRGIPSTDAVYAIDNKYGALIFTKTTDDKSVFYNVNTTLNSITFNAVLNNSITGTSTALKKLNLISPLNNNIFLASNDVIKVSPATAGLNINLVGNGLSASNIVPTLAT